MIYLAALLLGVVSGLRAFTAIGVLLFQRGGAVGILGAVVAVGEYVADAMPWIPARTKLPSIILRPVMGFAAGHILAGSTGGDGLIGGIGGVIGALAGTYGGYQARLWLIERIGSVAAALSEDAIALLLAVLVVYAR